MSDTELKEQLEKLRAENQALDQQVKLLVQTEQRLYRVQSDSDRQLERIRALNDLVLRFSGLSSERLVLKHALETLSTLFQHDLCEAIRVERNGGETHYRRWSVLVDEPHPETYSEPTGGPLDRFLETLERTTVIEVDEQTLPRIEPLTQCIDALTGESAVHRGAVFALLPLRLVPDELLGLIVLRKLRGKRSSFYLSPPAQDTVPFLQLVGNHIDRALHDVQVAAALRQRSMTLTERNRALQQSLTQAAKMELVGQLAGGIAHDFNNLLTVILSSSQFLGRRLRDLGLAAPELDDTEAAAERAAALTRQLLTFSRRQPRRLEVLSLNDLVRGLNKLLSRLLGERVTIELALDSAAKSIRADRGQIEQIVLNLAVNARDAMPDGGTIRVLTEAGKHSFGDGAPIDCVTLSIIDEGSGIDEQTQERIYEPFFTTKRPGEGTGMGLAMVYGIVTQSGGEIGCTSAVGKGTRFDVHLPASGGPIKPVESSGLLLMPSSGGQTVLFVEDEQEIRRLGQRVLAERGYSVVTAATAEEALLGQDGQGQSIDLLLTDVVLPGLSGIELAERLKALYPGLRVLFISGYAPELLDAHGLDEENDHYLPKPFTEDTLLASVAKALADRE